MVTYWFISGTAVSNGAGVNNKLQVLMSLCPFNNQADIALSHMDEHTSYHAGIYTRNRI